MSAEGEGGDPRPYIWEGRRVLRYLAYIMVSMRRECLTWGGNRITDVTQGVGRTC